MNLISRSTTQTRASQERAELEEQLRQTLTAPQAVPLSFAQQRLWLLDQLEPDSPMYNIPIGVELLGHVDSSVLQIALDQVLNRHEILRTRILCQNENPMQQVEDDARFEIVLHDLTTHTAVDREPEARGLIQAEVNRPFNLSSAPLLRASLLRFSPEQHWFVLTLHHSIADEWSLRILFRDLAAFYESRRTNRAPSLPELPIQYADYSLWQRNWIRGEVLEKQLNYWRGRLGGSFTILELPSDRPRLTNPTFRGSTQTRGLAASIQNGLKDIAGRNGASLFMVSLAAFKTLLHRCTQHTDILVGSPIAGRNRIETEDLIGFFVNTLVLRTDLSSDPTFEELLQRVREVTLGAYANQDLPFEKLVEDLRPERTLNHNPFTRVMFAVQSQRSEELRWPGLKLRFLEIETGTAKFDLTLVLQETERGLAARAEFNRDLFNTDSIARLLENYEALLLGIVSNPQRRLSELPMVPESARQTILKTWNATATDYPRDKTVPELFAAQVERTPNAIAVAYGDDTMSFRELDSRSNQLARYLKTLSVGPNVPVGLFLDRSSNLIVSMLGVLKAGGCYVPLDPSYPKVRLAQMLNDSKAPVLITKQDWLDHLPQSTARAVCVDSDWEFIGRESRERLPNTCRAEAPAYIIYTSGSTGQPKGVTVPHRAIVRLVTHTDYIQLTPADRVAQASNTSFDAATFEIWGALLNGAQLLGISVDVALSPREFARELRERKISVLFLTTALFNQIVAEKPDAFTTTRVVMFGGEAVDPKWVRAVLKHPPTHLFHVYGPTENTTFSTWHEIRELAADALTIPIGRPIANSQCYILDPHLNPVPIGVPGELHLAGDGLAIGYWNQATLTDEKFIANPFSDGETAKRLYKTGDLARWLPDGTLVFIGRLDHQVKLRGFRVELGEIESVLAQHSGIRDCVVVLRSDDSGDKKLAAYFVENGGQPTIPELRQYLKDKLPDYMVPSAFVRLETIPLTPNGKINRDALPEPDKSRPEMEKRYATPQDAVELELTRIWVDVLGIQPIGIQDKFFELGGHSLLAVRVIAQIEKAFNRKLKLATIFQAQTIEQLAAILRKEIQEDSAISGTSLVEIQPKGSRTPIFFVHGAGGGMFWGYVNLSRHLGADQPVYGLRSRGQDGRDEFPTVEQMAAQYIADLHAIQPRGPYHLGGYCFGGNVAYEMARQLRQQGEQVQTLALFNCAPANSRYSRISASPQWIFRFLVNLFYWGKYFLNWTPPQRREFFRWKRQMFKRRADRLLNFTRKTKVTIDAGELVDLSSYSEEQRKLWESHIRALVNYHPQPYAGRVHLFRSPGHPLLCSFDPDYGWSDLAKGDVQITVIPGVHEKILEEPCVETLAGHLRKLLSQSPQRNERLPSVTNATSGPQAQSLATACGNNARPEFLVNESYAQLFEAQVSRSPESVALRFHDQQFSFGELNARANRLALYLQTLGVGPETLVGICLDRSLDLPVALLAVLKAGGAYLPLDRSYPAERLAYMLSDSKANVLLTQSTITNLAAGNSTVVCLDNSDVKEQIARCSDENPRRHTKSHNLAYVIYTSGSTGAPKGVEITHRSLLNHNLAVAEAYRFESNDRVLQFSPFSFDISIEEIFPAWLRGCAVVMRTDDSLSSSANFLDFVRRENLSVLNVPTAYWHELVDRLEIDPLPACVRLVIIGGEKASDAAWQRWKKQVASAVTLINAYGPTETTITATMHIANSSDESLPIGRPLANTQALILDSELNHVAPGAEGELYIGGAGLARGYRHQPDKTDEKFIRNPFPEIPSDRLYKTGDLARFRPDGSIEFIGRRDDQIKLRGYRVELGEIENALRTYPGIKDAAAVLREDVPGKKRLVGYVVSRDAMEISISTLRDFLKGKLPAYLLPSLYVQLKTLPLTPSGKVDRRQLPPPGEIRPELDQQYIAPRTPVEEAIADVWCQVLGINHVGVHDSFFDLGGHSLLAAQVISRIRDGLQVEISLSSFFSSPTVAGLAEKLIASDSSTRPILPISAISRSKLLPLTPTQTRIWFLDQFDPQQSPYNLVTSLRLEGSLNLAALEKSMSELANRHEALRAVFPTEDGQPLQMICEPKNIPLPVIDLRTTPAEDREMQARSVAAKEGRRPYVMSLPTLRPVLLRMSDTEHWLLLITHAIACDAVSVRLLINDLAQIYDAFAKNVSPDPSAKQLSYSEALAINRLSPEKEAEQLAYWKQQLAGATELLDLPADRPRPAHQSDAGARRPIALSKEISDAVLQLSRHQNCEPFVTLLAVFQCLLSRYTGSTDILVGSILANRNRRELRGIVGKFDDVVALRTDLSGDPSFAEILQRVRKITAEAWAHGDIAFARLLSELRPNRNASYSPVFQVMFTYEDEPVPEFAAGKLRITPLEIGNATAKFDLNLHLEKTEAGLCGWIEYSTALFDMDRMDRMVEHFRTLLEGIVEDPKQRLSVLPLMPEAEANRVLIEWNATQKPYATRTTLVGLFEEQVLRTPDAIALIDCNDRLSFAELNARANQLAHHLRSIGVGPGALVGICLERSWRMLVGILGVLKAGGAYVPLDPAYPKDRLAFILQDTKAPVLLTQESLRNLLPTSETKVICLDSDRPEIHTRSRANVFNGCESTDLAYVIYTSGSTGQPKGVAIEHRCAVALVCWAKDVFTPEEISGVLASTSVCFDLSIFEMFVPLSWGGTIILAENALALPTLPSANEVTLINTVPSAIRELLRVKGVPSSVQVVNLAGEPLATSVVNRIYAETQARKVYDLYGPSETTTYSTFTLRQAEAPATIGRPLANEQVYVLDKNREPIPIGIAGELYIGGDKLARGYLNRPELTAEKFLPNPFKPGTRLYRTGDLARWRTDGNLEFLGRIDHQVKIRGFRIELGEIESALRRHPDLRESIVLAREDSSGNKRLVAYLVSKSGNELPREALRAFLKEHVPEYMVPSAFVFLNALPLTPNGKVNRKVLPEPDSQSRGTEYLPPRTPLEEKVAAIWCEVLRVNRVGLRDNFFELGGDSLLAIQIISRVRETCKLELPLFSLFDAPTIELLAKGLESGTWNQNELPVLPLQAIPRNGPLPVSFVQERLWFLDQLDPGNHAYNVAVALRLKGHLNCQALLEAINVIARRHEALRTTFCYENGTLTQRISAEGSLPIHFSDFADTTVENRENALRSWLKAEAQRPFDLATGPLTRIYLTDLAETDHALLVVMHHTISDGWSLTLLYQELEAFYNAFAVNQPAPRLPELPFQYVDFAHGKRQWMQGEVLERELNFWKSQLKDAPDSIVLPTDYPEPEKSTQTAKRELLFLPKETANALAQLSHSQNNTGFGVLISTLAIVLEKWTQQRDLVIGTVVAGRNRREMENVIGCFMNFLPIRTRLSPDETGQEFLTKVRTAILEAQEHQDCPFEKIVEAVNPERRRNRNPLYNVALLLQNFPTELFKSDQLEVSSIPIDLEVALLDLRFEAEWTDDGLSLACEYKTDLFAAETIRELFASYQQILEALIRDPATKLADFKITEALQSQAREARRRQPEQTVNIAATFTAEPIEDSLRYWAKELELPLRIEFAPYNQVFQELLDPGSRMAASQRGLNVLLLRPEDWFHADESHQNGAAESLDRVTQEFVTALRSAAGRTTTPFLVLLCPPSKPVMADPQKNQIVTAVETLLLAEVEKISGAHIVSAEELLKLYPVADYYDASGDELGRVPYTPTFFTALGTMVMRRLHALGRTPHKVIVLDLDQTLWSGVCGEDGPNGIRVDAPRKALQEFMREQRAAGRMLAVCSKNNEEDVREVFRQRIDMPLRHEHFVAWRTNWNSKSENIRSIAHELNLGLDSFIFVDDNPVECAEVEANCPEVLTLQLPEDPEQIPQFLNHCWVFDNTHITAEDRKRGDLYRENQKREELRHSSMGLADFVTSLNLQIVIEPMSPEQLERVAQLTHRTNQFNCTTIRRTEADVQQLRPAADILTVTVCDRFGDYGLVGVVICSPHDRMLDVETFLLSCRVLGRGVEHAILARLGNLACERQLEWVDVHYHRSEKNKPAFDFLENVGASYRQALNGGFIYRFPAQTAAQIRFNPRAVKAPENSPRAEQISAIQQTTTRNNFNRCRTIALEANDAGRIHQSIEAQSTARSTGQTNYTPPTTEMERQVCGIWEKLLRVERVGVNDNFFDLGGHSLLAVRLFAEIEKLTNRKFPLVTIFQAPTVEQLARVLSDGKATPSRSPIVPVQPNGSRPPLFLAHGVGGDVLWGYANLAKHLPPDQPIYGIKSRGQIGLEEYDRIEDMSRYYVEEIRAIQPHGPYYLGGYCLGGNVAYEMARQLRAQGEEIAAVLLIDAFPANAGYERITWWRPQFLFRFTRNAWYWLEDFKEQTAEERRRFVARKTRMLGRKLRSKLSLRTKGETEVDLEEVIDPAYFPEHELKFWEIHLRALTNHVEGSYDGPVTLIRTRGQPLLCSFAEDFCWGKLAKGGVTLKRIPGSHENIFIEPNVRFLAEQLQSAIVATQNGVPAQTEELISA